MEGFLIIVLLAVIILLPLKKYIFEEDAAVYKKMNRAKAKSTDGFKDGQTAKISGCIERVGTLLVAPLTGRECVYYYVSVEETGGGNSNLDKITIISKEDKTLYVTRDNDKCVLIGDADTKINIMLESKFHSGFRKDATKVIEDFLKRHGQKSTGIWGANRSLYYTELILQHGDKVAVVGTGNWQPACTMGLPETYGDVLVMGAKKGQYVYMSDNPGTIDNDNSYIL